MPRFQFSLRTLFLVVTIAAVALWASKIMGAMFALTMLLIAGIRMARSRHGEGDARIVADRPISHP